MAENQKDVSTGEAEQMPHREQQAAVELYFRRGVMDGHLIPLYNLLSGNPAEMRPALTYTEFLHEVSRLLMLEHQRAEAHPLHLDMRRK